MNDSQKKPQSQADKFREAAKEHEADGDESKLDEAIRKIAKDKSGGKVTRDKSDG